MLFKLAFKSVISRKSSFVIIFFISFAVFLFCISNALFDSTEEGVQASYISSFTGDLVIRSNKSGQNSLFGDETPITGELTKVDFLFPYNNLIEYLESLPEIENFTEQISCLVAMEYGGSRDPMYLFGVDGNNYLNLMSSVHLISGEPYIPGNKGVMISAYTANSLGAGLGDTIQFTVSDGPYLRIRASTITGIYDYDIKNEIYKRFILIDPFTVRSLLDVSDGNSLIEVEKDKAFLLDDDLDLDEIFFESEDVDFVLSDNNDSYSEVALDTEFEENNNIFISEVDSGTTWNNIIIRLSPGNNAKKVIRKLNKYFKNNEWPLEATDWRHAAGSTALYLHWMRIIINIGIFIILFAGFIIVNNTLIVNVLDRTKEIGTMRAIGARKRFISAQCMVETFIMTISSGLLGTFWGIIFCFFINKIGIAFSNSFLVQLFGSDSLQIFVTGGNVIKQFLLVFILGFIGWIYPVLSATKVSPVKAIQGGK